MQTATLAIIFVLLIIVLLVLVIMYTSDPKKKKNKKSATRKNTNTPPIRVKPRSFNTLYEIIKSKSTSEHDLKVASEEVLDNYVKITPKLGLRPHPDFDKYATIIMSLCRHPNTNKDIILHFDKLLQKSNPDYKVDIENFLTKGLNSRGI